jgi:hypothetical protein
LSSFVQSLVHLLNAKDFTGRTHSFNEEFCNQEHIVLKSGLLSGTKSQFIDLLTNTYVVLFGSTVTSIV